ncbi:MAG: DUF4214 domain-containing protein, partial [Acidimicrobiia bacterium]
MLKAKQLLKRIATVITATLICSVTVSPPIASGDTSTTSSISNLQVQLADGSTSDEIYASGESVPFKLSWIWNAGSGETVGIPAFHIGLAGELNAHNTEITYGALTNNDTSYKLEDITFTALITRPDFTKADGYEPIEADTTWTVSLDLEVSPIESGSTIGIFELQRGDGEGIYEFANNSPALTPSVKILSTPTIDNETFTLTYNDHDTITLSPGDGPNLDNNFLYFITVDESSPDKSDDGAHPNQHGTVTFTFNKVGWCATNPSGTLEMSVYAAQKGAVTADGEELTDVGWILSEPTDPITVTNIDCSGGNGDGGSGDKTPDTSDDGSSADEANDQAKDEVDETGNLTPAGLAKVAKKWASAPQSTAQNTAVGFMQRLYLGIFLRQGDQGGLEYWANLRQAGVSEQQIISSFLNSPEGQKALGQFDTQR